MVDEPLGNSSTSIRGRARYYRGCSSNSHCSPRGMPYFFSMPVGFDGVTQFMVTSFLKHRSMSTALKKATDCGRS